MLSVYKSLTDQNRKRILDTLIRYTNNKVQFDFWRDCIDATEQINKDLRERVQCIISNDFNNLAIDKLRYDTSLDSLHQSTPKWENINDTHKWTKYTIKLLKESSNLVSSIPNAESQLALSDYANTMITASLTFYTNTQLKNVQEAEDLLNILRDLYLISYNSDVKEKCAEFGKKVKEEVKYLAPESLRAQSDTIQDEIKSFCDKTDEVRWSMMLVRNCIKPLIEIKEALGEDNPYYKRISTQIADNALYSADIELAAALRKYDNPANDKEKADIYLRTIITNCGILISNIKQLNVESSFDEEKAKPFLKRIVNLMTKFEIDAKQISADISLMPETDRLSECGNDYQKLMKFVLDNPNSPQFQEAIKRIWEIEDSEFPSPATTKTLLEYKQKFYNSHNDLKILNLLDQLLLGRRNGTLMEYKQVLRLWPDHPKRTIIEGRIDLLNFKNCVCSGDWEDYLKAFPNGQHRAEAQRKIEEEKFGQCKTIADYSHFIHSYPASDFYDAACSKVEVLIFQKSLLTGDYAQYIRKYPNGKHIQ